jgi:hypothetical protein
MATTDSVYPFLIFNEGALLGCGVEYHKNSG